VNFRTFFRGGYSAHNYRYLTRFLLSFPGYFAGGGKDMTEKLFQYIWSQQYFDLTDLKTSQGEHLTIFDRGVLNKNQGPDFLSARVKIGEETWFGNIELHLLSSDWFKHAHHLDRNYNNVILHVVWKNDAKESFAFLPVIELESRISRVLLSRYEDWMNLASAIPCENNLAVVEKGLWDRWLNTVLHQRLERKASYVLQLYAESNHHWTETFWWLIARNFGVRVNSEAFENIARSIPVKLLTRHKDQILVLESLIFGQAGLLDRKFTGHYPRMLQKEFRHYRRKYSLKKTFVSIKFLRMRPSAFPTLRLAQLAMLIHRSNQLFSKIIDSTDDTEIAGWLEVTANDYWHYHYRFEEETALKEKNLGADMIESILINTVAPVLYAYGSLLGEDVYKGRAVTLLRKLPREENRVLALWKKPGIQAQNAAESQALLELKTAFCDYKRCLDCEIGVRILADSEGDYS
jgi:hypothetical protein